MADETQAKTADPFEGPAVLPDDTGAFEAGPSVEVHDTEPTDAQVGAAVRAFLRALDRLMAALIGGERASEAELRETHELVSPAAGRALKRAGPVVWFVAAVLGVLGMVAGKVAAARPQKPVEPDAPATPSPSSHGPLGRRPVVPG